jgi:transcription initiation factor TFIID subunit TAF12
VVYTGAKQQQQQQQQHRRQHQRQRQQQLSIRCTICGVPDSVNITSPSTPAAVYTLVSCHCCRRPHSKAASAAVRSTLPVVMLFTSVT